MTQGELFGDAPPPPPAQPETLSQEVVDRVIALWGALIQLFFLRDAPATGWIVDTVWVTDRAEESPKTWNRRTRRVTAKPADAPPWRSLIAVRARPRSSLQVDFPFATRACTHEAVTLVAEGVATIVGAEAPAIAAWLTTGEVRS